MRDAEAGICVCLLALCCAGGHRSQENVAEQYKIESWPCCLEFADLHSRWAFVYVQVPIPRTPIAAALCLVKTPRCRGQTLRKAVLMMERPIKCAWQGTPRVGACSTPQAQPLEQTAPSLVGSNPASASVRQ